MLNVKLIDGSYASIDNQLIDLHVANDKNCCEFILTQFEDGYYNEIVTVEDKIVADWGANAGFFSLFVSPYAEKIISIEPFPEHFEKLKIVAPKSIAENAAMAGHDGVVDFHLCELNFTMHSLQYRHGNRKLTVPCMTIKTFFEKYGNVDFLKVDIEGGEHEVFAPELVKGLKGFAKKLFIELHPPDLETQEKFTKIFEGEGYTVTKMFHDSLLCQ